MFKDIKNYYPQYLLIIFCGLAIAVMLGQLQTSLWPLAIPVIPAYFIWMIVTVNKVITQELKAEKFKILVRDKYAKAYGNPTKV